MMKTAFVWVGGFAGLLAVGFVLQLFGFYSFSFFAPKYEGVRRDVMIESRAYSEATVRELYRLKKQYETTENANARAGIAAAARHEFSIFPQDRLPPDLQVWMAQIGR